jgi:hypothetical protein
VVFGLAADVVRSAPFVGGIAFPRVRRRAQTCCPGSSSSRSARLRLPGVTSAATEGVPASTAGLAAGLLNASMQLGGAHGLAVLPAAASIRTQSVLHATGSSSQALTAGFQHAFLIAAARLLAAALIAFLTTTRPTTHTPDLSLLLFRSSRNGESAAATYLDLTLRLLEEACTKGRRVLVKHRTDASRTQLAHPRRCSSDTALPERVRHRRGTRHGARDSVRLEQRRFDRTLGRNAGGLAGMADRATPHWPPKPTLKRVLIDFF